MINDKETASDIELNIKFWSGKTKIVFSCETHSNNLCFTYNFEKYFFYNVWKVWSNELLNHKRMGGFSLIFSISSPDLGEQKQIHLQGDFNI